ncbi:hypothetical protein CBP51_16865 [Cellvibrio mixtus]|uniref:DUF2730 domain-containing protein n=1 Tax=Cellvibrio mixtus TaxID=39650 RepID=A0A266Q4N3_9GAMM|nr:DUF2730 family protein [Cellvibrio mixtus]OZY84833.1 hypothetical protein CBP51_16865 [Cellvibrio mixtus]
MNIEEIKFGLGTVQWLVMAAIGIYAWVVRRGSASRTESEEKFAELEAQVLAVRERLVALEAEVKNMPTELSVRELIAQLASLKAYQEGNKQQLNTMQHTVNRINDFLLNQR